MTTTSSAVALGSVAATGIADLISGSEEMWDFLTNTNPNPLCKRVTYDIIDAIPDLIIVDAVKFTLQSTFLNICLGLNPSAGTFAFPSGGHDRLGWAFDLSGTRVDGFVPIWVHSQAMPLPQALLTPSTGNPSGFTAFVLNTTWLPSSLTEIDPGGFDNLTFKLSS